jgi:hypothetical protein
MDKYFIRLKVVEDDINNDEEFLVEFNRRCSANEFPIVIKIDEAPDITRLTIDGMKLVDFITLHQDRGQIIVETDNLVQDVAGIHINKWFNELPFFHFKGVESKTKTLSKKFMLFVGNHRWPRFLLAESLYKNYKEQSYITYWHSNIQTHNIVEHLDAERIKRFADILPLYVDSKEQIDRHQYGYINFTDTNALEEFYHTAFLDIVCETWHMGNTFLPTEKIARPLALKNPFVLYGPKHFLRNLRRLGFKTFGNYWSEEYDNHAGVERIKLITKQIDSFANESETELEKLYKTLEPVLEHNQKLYQTITLDAINTEFSSRLT